MKACLTRFFPQAIGFCLIITTIGIPLVQAQTTATYDVSAVVPAQPTDFSAVISTQTPGTNFPQGQVLDYTITYGTNLSYPSSVTVQAEWSRGTVEPAVTPSEDILEYVVGSASTGYGSAIPVVDTLNRKISWTIPTFPGNTTNQTLSFSLRTTNSYTGTSKVDFTVAGRVIGQGTQTVDSTITRSYLYDSSLVPTPAPTSVISTATPTPRTSSSTAQPTATPSYPKTNLGAPIITSIQVQSLSATSAELIVGSQQSSTLTIHYGLSPRSLTQTLTLPAAEVVLFSMTNLRPSTAYFFTVTATNQKATQTTSEIFTLTTAAVSTPIAPAKNTLTVTSMGVILLNQQQSTNQTIVVLPAQTPYELQFATTGQAVQQIQLGISAINTPLAQKRSDLSVSADAYLGQFISPPTLGLYQLTAWIFDRQGNVSGTALTQLRVVTPFTVISSITHTPLEKVQVIIEYFDEETHLYMPLSPSFPLKNPFMTDVYGHVSLVLPMGKYRAIARATGYTDQTVPFTIDISSTAPYPTIRLSPLPFSILGLIKLLFEIIMDVWLSLNFFMHEITTSTRYAMLFSALTIALSVWLTFLAFLRRIKMPWKNLPLFVTGLPVVLKKQKEHLVMGIVHDEQTGERLGGVHVFLLDKDQHRVLSHDTTDHLGIFHLVQFTAKHYQLALEKRGYIPPSFLSITENEMTQTMSFAMEQIATTRSKTQMFFSTASLLWDMSFEFLLLLTLVFEGLFIHTFGLEKIWPFFLLSTLNAGVWVLHIFVRLRKSY